MRTTTFLSLLVPLALAACDPDRELTNPTDTLAERLSDEGEHLFVMQPSAIEVTGRYTPGVDKVGRARLEITAGELDVRLEENGDMTVDALTFELADITVQPASRPIHLTDMRVTLALAASGGSCWTWSGDEASFDTEMTLLLDWALAYEVGEATPLTTQAMGPFPVHVELAAVDERVVATLDLVGPGVFWDWAGIIQLSDLHVELAASDLFLGPVP